MLPMIRRSRTGEEANLADVFGRWFDLEGPRGWSTNFVPSIDVKVTDTEVKFVAECPGIKKEDINITLESNVLTISGEKAESFEKKDGEYFQTERRFGKFSRSFTLPAGVDVQKVEAKYSDGLLEVTIAKVKEAQTQKVQIKDS